MEAGGGGGGVVLAVGQPGQDPRGRRVQVVVRQPLVVLPVRTVVDHDMGGLGPFGQRPLQRGGGRGAPHPDDEVRHEAADHVRDAQEMVVGAQDGGRRGVTDARCETRAGKGIGQGGDGPAGREAGRGGAIAAGIGGGADDDQGAARRLEAVHEHGVPVVPSRTWRPRASPVTGRRGLTIVHRLLGRRVRRIEPLRGFRLQWLVERHVEVHGPARRTHRVPRRPLDGVDHRTRARGLQGSPGRHGKVGLEAHTVAEYPRLVDGLVGVGAPHRGRTVRGDDDQRHIRHVRLDDGRQQVGDRRPRRGDDRRRSQVAAAVPDREEAGGALVEVYPSLESRQ